MPRTKLHPPSGDNSKSDKKADNVKSKNKSPGKVKITPEIMEQSPGIMAEIMNQLEFSSDELPDGSQKRRANRKKAESNHIEKSADAIAARLANYLGEQNLKPKTENLSPRLARTGNVAKPGNTVCIRVTAPLKPGHIDRDGTGTNQYDLSIYGKNFPYSEDGLKQAYQEALQLGFMLNDRQREFVWPEKFLGKKQQNVLTEEEKPKTIGELLDEFEGKYFLKKKRNRQSESTFSTYLYKLNRFLQKDVPLSVSAVLHAIEQTEAGTSNRAQLVPALRVFCNHFDFKFDFRGYSNGYEPQPRHVPSDKQISVIGDW